MKKHAILLTVALAILASCKNTSKAPEPLRTDARYDEVEKLAKNLASQGFNAGSSYAEVWIRDYNTFIELSMETMPDSLVRENLNTFFAFQGEDGNIVDGFVPINKSDVPYNFIYSDLAPQYMAHKNTVETDQETSLVQAVAKYVRKSGNKEYLQQEVYGATVYEHLVRCMEYILNCKMDSRYGLVTGATTVDWGDVQPENDWGVRLNENSHICCDPYDNAMFVLALNDMAEMATEKADRQRWEKLSKEITKNTRQYLWDEENQKFRPHLYLKDSPFPEDFPEDSIFVQGSTAVAILAGILEDDEIDASLAHMLDCQKKANAQTIGITVYPPYPDEVYLHRMSPYTYQNGGDWTWFGARMVHALAKYGKWQEAHDVLSPMLDRVIQNQSFYEWYKPDGTPQGSGTFRGEAGVLYTAIEMMRGN